MPATLRASYIRGGTLTINRGSHVFIEPNGTDARRQPRHQVDLRLIHESVDLNDNDLIVRPRPARRRRIAAVIF
jgi:hypothetical protein